MLPNVSLWLYRCMYIYCQNTCFILFCIDRSGRRNLPPRGNPECPLTFFDLSKSTSFSDQTISINIHPVLSGSSSLPCQDYKEPIREMHKPSSQIPLDNLRFNDSSSCFFLHFAKWGHWCSSILANLTNSQTFETTEVWNRKTPIYKIGHFVHS